MPDYPPGYDPIQADPNSGSYISPEDQYIGGLIALGALSAVAGLAAFFNYTAAGALTGTAIDGALSQAVTGTVEGGAAVMAVEEMFAVQLVERASIEEASAYITRMAYERALAALMTEEAAIAAAQTQAAAVMAVALANVATVNAAIITAAANVQEQQALHAFFPSGL